MYGRGTGAELRAIHLASFTTPSPFWSAATYLRGQHYARNTNSVRSGSFQEIYMWGDTKLREHRKAMVRSRDRVSAIVIYILHTLTLIFHREIPCEYSRITSSSVSRAQKFKFTTSLPSKLFSPRTTTLAVTLSPTTSHIRVLFTLPDEPDWANESDVRMGWRRAYIQYDNDALAISYHAWQHIVQSGIVAAKSCSFRRVKILNAGGYESMADESSGRAVMQKTKSLSTIYCYSLYDFNI